MAGFVDVVLRGLILVLTSVALGGVAWLRLVLRAEPHVKPDAPTALALRAIAAAGAGAALAVIATLLVASSAVVSHAVARVEWRAPLIALDAAHQVAAALWVGGLAHLVLLGVAGYASPPIDVGAVARRFSTLAFRAMAAIVLAGLALTFAYVGDLAAFVGTAYGVMVLSKVALLVPALALAWLNMRAVRRAAEAPGTRLFSFVEIELGLGITILFAAASLTSLPPAVDVTTDRATVAEVAARFAPAAPRLTSPPIDELLRAADPLMGRQVERKPVERAWSEYNHHWAGLFVVTMGVLAILHFLGLRAARHWPLVFLGLATFLFIRNDPRAWPLGPAG